MNSLIFFYGNLELARGEIGAASDRYNTSLKLYLKTNPVHMLTASLYYKLGIVEAKRGDAVNAW